MRSGCVVTDRSKITFLIANYVFVRIKTNLFNMLIMSCKILQFSIQKDIMGYLCPYYYVQRNENFGS
jgi:hypothetical protein